MFEHSTININAAALLLLGRENYTRYQLLDTLRERLSRESTVINKSRTDMMSDLLESLLYLSKSEFNEQFEELNTIHAKFIQINGSLSKIDCQQMEFLYNLKGSIGLNGTGLEVQTLIDYIRNVGDFVNEKKHGIKSLHTFFSKCIDFFSDQERRTYLTGLFNKFAVLENENLSIHYTRLNELMVIYQNTPAMNHDTYASLSTYVNSVIHS